MSNTAVVKVYGSSRTQALLAMVPVYGEGLAQPDDILIDFARFQVRRRLPAEKLDVSQFKIERKPTPKPPYPVHPLRCDRRDARAEREDHLCGRAEAPPGDWVETQNGSL